MEKTKIDARGRSCPEPIIMTQKAIKAGAQLIEVTVDNITAIDNVSRFAENSGFKIDVKEENSNYILGLSK